MTSNAEPPAFGLRAAQKSDLAGGQIDHRHSQPAFILQAVQGRPARAVTMHDLVVGSFCGDHPCRFRQQVETYRELLDFRKHDIDSLAAEKLVTVDEIGVGRRKASHGGNGWRG